MVGLVAGEDAARKLDDICVSNDTLSRRINEISLNIKEQVVDEIKKSPLFAIQLDESTDVSQFSQLLAFVRYVRSYMRKVSRRNFYFASLSNSILELRMC